MKSIIYSCLLHLSMVLLSGCATEPSFEKERAEWKALLGFEQFVPDEKAEYTPVPPPGSEYKNPFATLPWEKTEVVDIDDLFLELKKISPQDISLYYKITTP